MGARTLFNEEMPIEDQPLRAREPRLVEIREFAARLHESRIGIGMKHRDRAPQPIGGRPKVHVEHRDIGRIAQAQASSAGGRLETRTILATHMHGIRAGGA